MILTIRTDKPQAEIGLYDGKKQLAYETWEAHRELAETIHKKVKGLIEAEGKSLRDVTAIVAYKGPGSFTGLRIGLSVANALAYAQQVPIVGIEGEVSWLERGLERLERKENDQAVMPEYGAPVHITQPRS